jgi:hypothetical protein
MFHRHAMGSLVLFPIVVLLACDRPPPPAGDSVADTTPRRVVDRPAPWVTELGPLFVVPSDSENTGVVLFPYAPSAQLISSAPLVLLSSSGDTTPVQASLVASDSRVCGEAPTIRLLGDTATAWSAGLRVRSFAPIRMDSIESMSPDDSARFAVDLARLASTMPVGGSRFAGLPFVVLSARRFDVTGTEVVVAHLARRVPQEASPFQEHTLVVGERASAAEPFQLRHHRRSEGTEETVDHYDLLSAVLVGGTPFLLLSRDRDAQTVYEILQRAKTGEWRARWERTLAC